MNAEPVRDYTIRHVGKGSFVAVFDDGEVKNIGPSLSGMLRYLYFEDFSLPPDNWEVRYATFLPAYHSKVFEDIKAGKFYQDPADGMFKMKPEFEKNGKEQHQEGADAPQDPS